MSYSCILDFLKNDVDPSDQDWLFALEWLMQLQSHSLNDAESKQVNQFKDWVDSVRIGKLNFNKMQKKLVAAAERLLLLWDQKSQLNPNERVFPFDLIPDLEIDLSFGQEFLAKCAEVHWDDLDLLEKSAIDLENFDPDALINIKRFLHTMKGDFGVIGINSYADWIHQTEDLFESKIPSTDHILRIKDFLFVAFKNFTQGVVPKLSQEILDYLLFKESPQVFTAPELTICEEKQVQAVMDTTHLFIPQDLSQDMERAAVVLPEISEDIQSLDRNLIEDPSLISDFVIESKEGLEIVLPQILELETGNLDVVNKLFRSCHTIKGLCGFIGLPRMGTFSHYLEDLLSEIRLENLKATSDVTSLIQEGFDILFEMILSVEKRMGGETLNYPQSMAELFTKLVAIRYSDSLHQAQDEAVENTQELAHPVVIPEQVSVVMEPKMTPELISLGDEIETKVTRTSQAETKYEIDEMIRVSTRKLDQLIDTIGETVIAQSMLEADSQIINLQDLILEKKLSQSNMLIRRIQELSMSLRMVPIQSVFQKMSRLVRDLSKKMNKNVRFDTMGEDTELDKSIVEQIADPLMHMVRNSMDHGLESAEDRLAQGKSAQGTLCLRAFNQSGAIFIEIEDDGRGLDSDKILDKALRQGLCTKEEAQSLSELDIYRFIFHPGFSTAEKITDVSGRGVGMDVVKKNIDALRGSIVITSTKGKGTLFSIRLPLTLAIIDGMLVNCGGEVLIIPTLSIVQSVKCDSKSSLVQEPDGSFLFDILGSLIPVIGITQLYEMSNQKINVKEAVVIVVEDMEGNRIGLLVDEILGQQQIVIKNLGNWIGAVPGIAGGAIMNSGLISLIVDIPELIRMSRQSEGLRLVQWTENINEN